MSVAEHLGLSSPGTNELIRQARQQWPRWCASDPRLAVVDDPVQVPRWTWGVERDRADDVLHALASLAARDGGDDRAAAMTLCWTLLPAAASVANQLQGLTPEIDQAVASQMWVEARTFPWQRLRKVAANIRADTRAGVLRHSGDKARLPASDRTWGLVCPIDPTSPFWRSIADPTHVGQEPTASEELVEVLEWARRQDVITAEDQALLMSLVEAAERTVVTRSRRGGGGLMANALSEQVAHRWGVSPITVRRRARRSMLALADACRDGRYEACA